MRSNLPVEVIFLNIQNSQASAQLNKTEEDLFPKNRKRNKEEATSEKQLTKIPHVPRSDLYDS